MIRVYSNHNRGFGEAWLNVNTAWTIDGYWADEFGNKIEEAFFGTTVRFYYLLKGSIKYLNLYFSIGGANSLSMSRDVLSTRIEKHTKEEYKYIEIEIDDRWEFPVHMRPYHEMNISVDYSVINKHLGKEHLSSISVIQFHYTNGLITGGPNYHPLPSGYTMLSRRSLEQSVHALVLHRTAGSTLNSALNAMRPEVSAHLYVDTDGGIYQGVSLLSNASHVGRIRPRNEHRTPTNGVKHGNEIVKNYPDRYPFNNDSLGIEVVGNVINPPIWEKLTEGQILSTARLTNFIVSEFGLSSIADIYIHEEISSKTEGEGGTVYNAIQQFII